MGPLVLKETIGYDTSIWTSGLNISTYIRPGKLSSTCEGAKISPSCSCVVEENCCGNVFLAIHLTNVVQVKEFLYFECSKCEDRRLLIKIKNSQGRSRFANKKNRHNLRSVSFLNLFSTSSCSISF